MKQSGQISGRQFDWEEYLRQPVQAPCEKRHFAADVGCGITVCVDGFAARQILSFDGIWRCASDTCPVFWTV